MKITITKTGRTNTGFKHISRIDRASGTSSYAFTKAGHKTVEVFFNGPRSKVTQEQAFMKALGARQAASRDIYINECKGV